MLNLFSNNKSYDDIKQAFQEKGIFKDNFGNVYDFGKQTLNDVKGEFTVRHETSNDGEYFRFVTEEGGIKFKTDGYENNAIPAYNAKNMFLELHFIDRYLDEVTFVSANTKTRFQDEPMYDAHLAILYKADAKQQIQNNDVKKTVSAVISKLPVSGSILGNKEAYFENRNRHVYYQFLDKDGNLFVINYDTVNHPAHHWLEKFNTSDNEDDHGWEQEPSVKVDLGTNFLTPISVDGERMIFFADSDHPQLIQLSTKYWEIITRKVLDEGTYVQNNNYSNYLEPLYACNIDNELEPGFGIQKIQERVRQRPQEQQQWQAIVTTRAATDLGCCSGYGCNIQ